MKKVAKAWAPGNISCIFKICDDTDPAKKGSFGLGFTLDKGVTVSVSASEQTEIFFNGEKIDFPTVEGVIEKLSVYSSGIFVKVGIASELPLGGGFGVSGASALAVAYALNELFDGKKEKLDLAKIAHVAEVENQTGLGDVINQYFGGFLLKTVPSSQFKVHRVPIENIPVYCKFFSRLSTKSILCDTKARETMDTAADEALGKVQDIRMGDWNDKRLFAELLSISKEFTKKSGLLKDARVMKTIGEIEFRGGHASMILLGNAVMSDRQFSGSVHYRISSKHARTLFC